MGATEAAEAFLTSLSCFLSFAPRCLPERDKNRSVNGSIRLCSRRTIKIGLNKLER